MNEELNLRLQDGVLYATITRPQRRNAISAAVVNSLFAALSQAEHDPEVRVLVLSGEGDYFCAGADLDPARMAEGPVALNRSHRRFAALLKAFRRCRVPILAHLNGPVLGGGVALALGADLCVGDPTTWFRMPELKVGLFPMMVSAPLIRAVGERRALQWMLSARKISAQEAHAFGLLDVLADDASAEVAQWCETLKGWSPVALEAGRRAFYESRDLPYDDALDTLADRLSLVLQSADAAEGLSAFLMKRPPKWTGR